MVDVRNTTSTNPIQMHTGLSIWGRIMRFKRWSRIDFNDTSRKRVAVARKHAAECNAAPLFAEQIAEEQPSVDAVMSSRRSSWDAQDAALRVRRAFKWREGRLALLDFPEDVRRQLLAYWNAHRWLPGDPSYFLDMLHMYRTGQLNMAAPGATAARRST